MMINTSKEAKFFIKTSHPACSFGDTYIRPVYSIGIPLVVLVTHTYVMSTQSARTNGYSCVHYRLRDLYREEKLHKSDKNASYYHESFIKHRPAYV